ncbi:RICIN domain-containing protein [Enhygromyxa salina]|uniref:Ricin B lectin domain-containing protein n=1 Tax=Enhygromyxa salina TaxID=215803 RepID=A0A2S9YDK3_9BACT|nr:RICIN domain-containing protein [Enhygromyxa salina]PRQ03198.1 hypothetical protein ENSA7_53380 [Enhygromyxa salina]
MLTLALVHFLAVLAPADPIDAAAYYRLTTEFQGECKSLDIVNDATDDKPRLRNTAEVSGQFWQLTPVGDGYYRLTTMWRGEGYSLDIINDARDDTPILTKTTNASGQHWKLTPTTNGAVRLSTRWLGTDKSLDIVNDASDDRPILAATANVSGQHWRLTKESGVGPVPKHLEKPSFYKKYLDAEGIPILSSNKVPDAALYRVRYTVRQALSRVPAVRAKMIALGISIVVMGNGEVTTDIPEYKAKMPNPHDGRDIDTVRGYGASPLIPVQLCAEENVLCQAADTYPNEDIFLHEFAHNMHWARSEVYGKAFDEELDALYVKAKAKAKKLGKEGNTYAMASVQEYFAEGVQSWCYLNDESIPANGIHNHVNTRAELRSFDRGLHDLLARYLPEDRNNCSCHALAK